jgi:hypothetical protein
MVDGNSDIIINKIKTALQNKYCNFKGLYFFGSRSKKIDLPDSDYDVALTFEGEIDWRMKKEIYGQIGIIEIENDVIIDTHVYTLNDILNPSTPFRLNIKNEGVFYAAG